MTGTEAGYVLLGKELDIMDFSIDIWKIGWTEYIESRR